MATVVNLKSKDGTTLLYPKTLIAAVQNADGKTVDQIALLKDNTTVFTPTAAYQPATKKYVDDNSGVNVVLSANQPTGAVAGDFWFEVV